MHKNALFLVKNCKDRPTLGAFPIPQQTSAYPLENSLLPPIA